MIGLRQVSKGYWVQGEWRPVLREVTLDLPPGRALALLGGNGAGKTTLLNLLSGHLRPDAGEVRRDGLVSWPVGIGASFHRDLTGAQNVRFLARVYGVDSDSLCDFVADFAEIGAYFHMPMRTFSQGMRARLAFGVSMGIPFDTYLVDEVTAVGDLRFRRKSRRLFRDRIRNAGAVMVSHQLPELREYCDAALVLHRGRLAFFADLDAAIAQHEQNMAA